MFFEANRALARRLHNANQSNTMKLNTLYTIQYTETYRSTPRKWMFTGQGTWLHTSWINTHRDNVAGHKPAVNQTRVRSVVVFTCPHKPKLRNTNKTQQQWHTAYKQWWKLFLDKRQKCSDVWVKMIISHTKHTRAHLRALLSNGAHPNRRHSADKTSVKKTTWCRRTFWSQLIESAAEYTSFFHCNAGSAPNTQGMCEERSNSSFSDQCWYGKDNLSKPRPHWSLLLGCIARFAKQWAVSENRKTGKPAFPGFLASQSAARNLLCR